MCAFLCVVAPTSADELPLSREALEADSVPVDTVSAEADTQSAKKPKKENLFVKFLKGFNDADPAYVAPNYYKFTAMLQNTNFYQSYRMSVTDAEGYKRTLRLSPNPGFKVGPYFGWRWIFYGYTFDVSRPRRAGKSSEMNLCLYTSQIGADLVYVRNTNDFTIDRASGFSNAVNQAVRGQAFPGMDAITLSANMYYVFNHKHFSYPAAYAQSTVQRRSAGSWLLGIYLSRQRIRFDYDQLPSVLTTPEEGQTEAPISAEEMVSKVDYSSYNISIGYAYNWVFARNCLFDISLSPSLGIKRARGERVRGEDVWLNMRHLKFDVLSRAGIVWNNSHYFAGTSLVMYMYDYQKNRYSLTNSIFYLNVYVGFMFDRKSQYPKTRKK